MEKYKIDWLQKMKVQMQMYDGYLICKSDLYNTAMNIKKLRPNIQDGLG